LSHCVSKGRKSDIKAAWQRGLEVEILIPAEEAFDRFYNIYLEMCRRKSVKPFEKKFISTLAESFKEISRFWIAKTNDQDVGSALTFEFGNRLWIWFLQANRDFINYKVDSFLYAEIIQYGFFKNIELIDLGTSPLGSSLGDYKKRFGAKAVFHELYELDITLSGNVKRSYFDLKRVIKHKWLTERPD
jgi:predicted N-acyltransferase